MKKLKRSFQMFFPFLLTCCFLSCSDDNGKDGPEPVNPGELVLVVDDAPSRVKVGTTAEFTLKAVHFDGIIGHSLLI